MGVPVNNNVLSLWMPAASASRLAPVGLFSREASSRISRQNENCCKKLISRAATS